MKRPLALLLLLPLAGCSIKKMAVNKIGNALASGGSTFERDDDLELVEGALPFGLKLMESLLAESPKHKGLLLAACSGFSEYSYVYVDQRADEAMADNAARGNAMRVRARRLYLRARDYGLRGLDASYPGFRQTLEEDPGKALARVRKADVPLLYWTAASFGLAISVSKSDPGMLVNLPLVESMIARVSQLDEGWNNGAVPEFLISMESARVGVRAEEKQARIKGFYERALKLSKGGRASLFVSYAENTCLPAQDRKQFKAMLEKALAIDADAAPDQRLPTLVAQRRARWLLGRIDELFLDPSS
jgi:predicted anti-sigma-YlaC factor YlaD